MSQASFAIEPAKSRQDIEDAIGLFKSYADALGIDLCFQGFSEELASMPGKYAPPTGELLLARSGDGAAIGCVAMRPTQAPGLCEMKRLYVSPAARGLGLGKSLAEAIIASASRAGYREICLDTLPTMAEALSLYERLGFARIAPYYDTPIVGTVFMARTL
jgi:GNAT superfamily N-acetyltransferase